MIKILNIYFVYLSIYIEKCIFLPISNYIVIFDIFSIKTLGNYLIILNKMYFDLKKIQLEIKS